MNATDLELFRLSILQLLGTSADAGKPRTFLVSALKLRSYSEAESALNQELQYLIDKSFVAEVGKAISPENKRWRITADGRDFLATQGL